MKKEYEYETDTPFNPTPEQTEILKEAMRREMFVYYLAGYMGNQKELFDAAELYLGHYPDKPWHSPWPLV